MEWRHLLDDLHMLEDQRGREKRKTEGEEKERKDNEMLLLKESRVAGKIRARGTLGRFRIASCCVIQPGRYLTEWSKNEASSSCLEDCQDSNEGQSLFHKQSVSEIGTLK